MILLLLCIQKTEADSVIHLGCFFLTDLVAITDGRLSSHE